MITVSDFFCGAGGSSTGITQVPGMEVKIAANHWDLAIETHNTNHPTVDHAICDLHVVDPRLFPRTDVLWASPECTAWSQAGAAHNRPSIEEGLFEDPLSDDAKRRSRLLMFDVPRIADHHRYRTIVVENVVDIATQPRYANAWREWQRDMRNLGYRLRIVSLNSMHAQAHGLPAPQSRDRLYIVCWRDGDTAPDVDAVMRPGAWCEQCGQVVESRQAWKSGRTVGRYRAQYVYVCSRPGCGRQVEPGWLPAAAAIDWDLPGQRIGDRAKPLAPKTMERIRAGLARYARALLVAVEGRAGEDRVRPVDMAMRAQTTRNETGVLIPLRQNNTPKLTSEALDTVAASGNHHGLLMRNNSSKGDGAEMVTPTWEPARTMTTTGHQSLLMPYYGTGVAAPVEQPHRTMTTVDRYALLERAEADVMDCLFRMLEPHEIARAMAFPADYVMLGNKRERVRLAGNAVTPPAARDLIAAVAEALA